MAPRTRKNESANQRNGNGSGNSNSATSHAKAGPSSSRPTRRSSRQPATATSKRRSTQNATNLMGHQSMSDDSDFDTFPKGHTLTSRSNRGPAAAVNKRSAEDPSSSSSLAITTTQKQKKLKRKEDSDVDMKSDEPENRPSTPSSESSGGSEFRMEEESEDDEWEEVAIPAISTEAGSEDDNDDEVSGPWMYNPVEIVFDRPLQDIKKASKSKGITKEEWMIRILIHQTHLLCLLANGRRRNQWISHPKLSSVALSLVPNHIADSVQADCENPVKEVNALQVLALWWRDSFVVTGPGIHHRELDSDVADFEAAILTGNEECLKKRKNLQRKLLNRKGSTDVCSQLFTGICRSLGLKARLVESLQACSFKITSPKGQPTLAPKSNENSSAESSSRKKGKKKMKEDILDESDTTRGSRVVIDAPHRLPKGSAKLPSSHKKADPPVFWTEVWSSSSKKWITIDPVRGFVNSPLKMHPSSSCKNNVLAYVVAYDEDNYVTDVTRRYTSMWGSITKKLRVQPVGKGGFDWWAQTMSGLMNPCPTAEEDIEEAELIQAEVSERMPTRIGDFNNHPLYALERHLKKYEVLHPRHPVLGHVRGEAVYPRSCVKEVKSKENWLKKGRVIKNGDTMPMKWVKSHAATIYQMRLRQQVALSGSKGESTEDGDKSQAGSFENRGDDMIALFGEWQTEAYQPPWIVDGKVPRNQYGRQDVFTPDMVPIGGTHLKGRKIGQVARLLGVDYVEAVTGFEFQSRRSVPVVDGIIVPTECAELVLDAYQEVIHQQQQEAFKKKRVQVLKRWRLVIKGLLLHVRLTEEYGESTSAPLEVDEDDWVPKDEVEGGHSSRASQAPVAGETSTARGDDHDHGNSPTVSQDAEQEDSGGGFMFD